MTQQRRFLSSVKIEDYKCVLNEMENQHNQHKTKPKVATLWSDKIQSSKFTYND